MRAPRLAAPSQPWALTSAPHPAVPFEGAAGDRLLTH